jgi:hypothetical protein
MSRARGRRIPLLTVTAALAISLTAAGGLPAAGAAAATATSASTVTSTVTRSTSTAAAAAAGRTGGAGPAARAQASRIAPPVASGTLRVRGDLQDGRIVHASGLSWRPGRLRSGQRLLSFEVSYSWRACTARAGRCVSAADKTVTPFAARRYLVGHAGTGKYLRLNETAAEVVETDPANFSFSIIRASASRTTGSVVAAYRRGRPPVTEFVNGLPEHRTGSAEEYFQVNPPHYNTADGVPAQRYRIDGGAWRPLPASRLFYTGKLSIGAHRVAVRTSNRAGTTVRAFRWRVIPLPAPVACRRPAGQSCWYPPHLNSRHHPMRWDWQIGRVTPLQRTGARAVDIYDIDGFLTTRREVRQLHTTWQGATLAHPKAICYLDLAWEDYRPDASPAPRGKYFPAAALGKIYFGFPQERWVDFRQLNELKPMLNERLSMCARKGFDAVELDDIDNFDPASTTGFHITPGDAQNFLAYALNLVHHYGMTVLWKNAPGLAWWGVKYADGAIVEECYVYHECFASWQRGSRQDGITCSKLTGRTPCGWDVFTADKTARQPTGKWVGEAEYQQDRFVCSPGVACRHKREFATFCRQVYAPANGFAAVKFDVDLDGKMFYPCPKGT